MIETVKEHCAYDDCRYRQKFDFQPCCGYMIVTGEPRGCDISRCDKYSPGRVQIISTKGGFCYKLSP